MSARIGIVGGGAAGLMAVAALIEANVDADIFLLERNTGLGKKVLISGGGRCNVTTGVPALQEVLKRYPRGNPFLKPAFHRFSPTSVVSWFEAQGVPLKREADERIFPESDHGADVVEVFERLFEEDRRCHVLLGHSVIGVERHDGGFRINLKDRPPLDVTHLILTTGGQAYRHTGSTGDGYAFAETLGHTITPLAASLNAFVIKEPWVKQLAGVSWKDARLFVRAEQKAEARGPFLFTHQGVTGPAVFALSSQIAFTNYDPAHPLTLSIDLFPSLTPEELFTEIKKVVALHPRKFLLALLVTLMPRSLAEALIHTYGLDDQRHLCEQGNASWQKVVSLLKAVPLTLIGRSAGEEFVTAGGVETDGVDPRTMQSRICPNLYFGGELLNIDGYTGGFNLQASWATGRVAGESIAASLQEGI